MTKELLPQKENVLLVPPVPVHSAVRITKTEHKATYGGRSIREIDPLR